VKAGQVLVKMNDTQAKSAFQISLAQYFAARSVEARLVAELHGSKSLIYPKEFEQYKTDPRAKESMVLQEQLFASRHLALQSELAALNENIAGVTAQAQGLGESLDNKKAQLGFLKEQLDNTRDLAKEGYIPRSRLLDLERTYAQVNGAISEDIGNIARARRQISEIGLRRTQRQQEFQKEVRTQLTDIQRETEALESKMKAQTFDLSGVEVKAPVDGVVVGTNIFTRGGVVAPGARMMDVLPSEDALIVEGQLPVNLIDKVHAGLPVELIFSAFNSNRTPHIPGVLTQVSADRTIDERTGQSSYKVRAKVTHEGAKLIAEKRLEIVSGMPVELFVKTGERTMMSYLLKPIFDRSKSSMSED
jgi:protease secretion system membrane fusion protein